MMQPTLESLESGVSELLEHRNGEAHMGVIDATLQQRAFVSLLQAFNALLDCDQEFWAPHSDLVRVTLDRNAERIQQSVHLKLSRARERFTVIAALSVEQREALLAIISTRASEHSLEETTVECPACKSLAVALGSNRLEYGSAEFGKEGEVEGVPSWLLFSPLSLKCEACGLELDNPTELEAAGIGESWLNEDAALLQAFLDAKREEMESVAEYVQELPFDWES